MPLEAKKYGKPTPADWTVTVQITAEGAGRVHGDRVLREGEAVSLRHPDADQWVKLGWARHTTQVRALMDHLSVRNRVCMRGEVAVTDAVHAKQLADLGLVEVLG